VRLLKLRRSPASIPQFTLRPFEIDLVDQHHHHHHHHHGEPFPTPALDELPPYPYE
jgi:hypothetical protein